MPALSDIGWPFFGHRTVLGLAAVALLLSCGGGGSSSSSVPAPANLAVTYYPYQASLTWTPPTTPVDGFDLEGRLKGQTFTQLNTSLIPSSANAATLTFTEVPPELASLEFRMRSQQGGAFSNYSNTAAFTVPLNPVTYLLPTASADTLQISVTWAQASSLATQVVLDRSTADASGQPTNTWTHLADLAPASGTWIDTDVQESVVYVYRATNTDGATSSAPTLSYGQFVGPFAPTGFAGVPAVGGVSLSWTNHSTSATGIQILRTPAAAAGSNVLATLAPSATSYLDSGLAPGQYTYAIEVTDGVRITQGGSAVSAPLNPAGAPVLQGTALATVPDLANTAVLTASGSWIAGRAQYGLFSIYPPPGAAWNSWTVTDAALVGLGFLAADAQGAPHMAYGSTTTAATLPKALVHTWFDGQGWSSEKITDYDGSGSGLQPVLHIDPSGNPKVLVTGGIGAQSWADLRYLSRTGGIWASEAVGASLGGAQGLQMPMFGLDPAGGPHLLLIQNASLLDVTRASDGTWSSTTVTDPSFTAPLPPGTCLWLDNDNAWFIFENITYTLPGYAQIRAKAKVAGVWQPSILVDSFDNFPTWSAAITPDGARLAVAISADRGPLVYLRNAQGWTGASIPAPVEYNPTLGTGFDSGGRLHILILGTQALDWHE